MAIKSTLTQWKCIYMNRNNYSKRGNSNARCLVLEIGKCVFGTFCAIMGFLGIETIWGTFLDMSWYMYNNEALTKNSINGAGEIAQGFRALAALPGNLCSAPTHMLESDSLWLQFQAIQHPVLPSMMAQSSAQVNRQGNNHIHKIQMCKSFKINGNTLNYTQPWGMSMGGAKERQRQTQRERQRIQKDLEASQLPKTWK